MAIYMAITAHGPAVSSFGERENGKLIMSERVDRASRDVDYVRLSAVVQVIKEVPSLHRNLIPDL